MVRSGEVDKKIPNYVTIFISCRRYYPASIDCSLESLHGNPSPVCVVHVNGCTYEADLSG